MRTTSLDTEIARLSEDRSLPPDNGDMFRDYIWFSELEVELPEDEYIPLVDDLFNASKGTRSRETDLVNHYRHCLLALLNLARAALCHRWLLVSKSRSYYSNNFYLKAMKLSYSHMRDIIATLGESGSITLLEGKKYVDQPLQTRIFPSENIRAQLIKIALHTVQPIHPPYIRINQPEENYGSIIENLSDTHDDIIRLHTVNDFLKHQAWALKSPVTLVYKNNIVTGGRLYTPFQNLPSRNYKIRPNTLINNEKTVEIDFNANHLRMNLAVLAKQDAGDSPYEDIMELAGVTERDKVKQFITVAMGALSRDEAMNALYEKSVKKALFEKIEQATIKRYPKLVLFDGFGRQAQSLEGQVLLDLMMEGVDKGITALPLHDAAVVGESNADWCEEAMMRLWQEHTGCNKAYVRVSRK